MPLAYAPFYLFPLAILLPTLLFVLWQWRQQDLSSSALARRAALQGFLFGLGMFGVGVSWIYVSLYNFGNMNAPLAIVAVILFVSILALFPAIMGGLQARFYNRSPLVHGALLLAPLWVLLEWTRGWIFTGFPWLHLGYSQTISPLGQLAPWLGVYGVSFVTAVTAALLAAWWLQPRTKVTVIAGIIIIWAVSGLSGFVQWVQPKGDVVNIALVQGNVSLRDKWSAGALPRILQNYQTLSRQATEAEIIIWPEAAIPTYLDNLSLAFKNKLANNSKLNDNKSRPQHYLVGIVEREKNRQGWATYNSVAHFGQGETQVYRKRHLVPFGEFLPLKPLLGWLIKYLHIPMSDFSSGPKDVNTLKVGNVVVGLSICYEDAFGEEVIQALPQADFLVNVSEDAWFGDSLAPHQRLQMAQVRAMESGRYMVRAANTGPSVVINHRGQILARSPQFVTTVLSAKVQPMQGMTPYARTGNGLIISLMVVLLMVAGLIHFNRKL
ncbi:MAG: apolipoprotein N-acyltransferase [Gammaproteobacteria bacterium]|nr:MAG: apolipoprotein N-acyltransferase [Gammaproteobacteria bacterium]